MRSRGEVGGPRLAEDLADRVEQDRRSSRGGAGRRGRPRPARGAGSSPLPRRTGVSSTDRWRPRPHSRRSWTRIDARPCSWMRPGMLSASGPANIAGKSVRTSISRVMRRGRRAVRRSAAIASASVGRRWRGLAPRPPARRLRAGRDRARASAARAGRATRRRPRSRPARREDADERAHRGHVERCRTARRRPTKTSVSPTR